MYSIRKKLNFTIIASMILLLSVVAAFLYVRVATQVEQVFDTALFDKAHALISLTELDEEGLEFDFAEEGVMLEFEDDEAPQYYQLWEEGVEPLIKSPSLRDTDLPMIGTELGQHQFADLQLLDGRAGRLIEINFMPRVEDEDDEGEEEEYDYFLALSSTYYRIDASDEDALSATLSDEKGNVLARRSWEDGFVTVVASPWYFSNGEIDDSDHARLLLDVVAGYVAPGKTWFIYSSAFPSLWEVIWTTATDGTDQLRYISGDGAVELLGGRYSSEQDEAFVGGMRAQFGL